MKDALKVACVAPRAICRLRALRALRGAVALRIAALVLVSMSMAPSSATAQTGEAAILVGQAALAYDAGRFQEALELVTRAVALDPGNVRGHYYAGLAHLALGDADRAIRPLETARTLAPDDLDVLYQLGVAHFAVGEYDAATPLLERVYAARRDVENLGYYVGFLRYRRKAYAEAAEAFAAVRTTDPRIEQLTRFYRGLALGAMGLARQALPELEAARQSAAAVPIAGAALRFQEALTAQRPAAAKPFRLQLGLGFFYDDNVAINPRPSREPIAESLRTRKTASEGILASLVAEYTFWDRGPVQALASYSFLQTLHAKDDLDRFDAHSHQVGIAAFYRGAVAAIPYQLGLQYTFDFLFLGGEEFLSRHTPTLSLSVAGPSFTAPGLGETGNLTTVLARYQAKDFFGEPGERDARFASEIRDARNVMVGLAHVFRFRQDRHLLRFGYQYDDEDAEGRSFSYRGNRATAGGQVTLPWAGVRLTYDYDVHWRDYTGRQTLFPTNRGVFTRRHDTEQTHLIQVITPLPLGVSLIGQYQGVDNASNVPVYAYAKNVFSIIATWAY